MSHAHNHSDDVAQLRREARLNDLKLKIARQNEALSALRRSGHADRRNALEGYYDPANYFDPRDYLFEAPRFGGAIPTTRNDRDEGRNYPIFRTEQELSLIRGAARWLTASNPVAVGVLTSLTNYVIGNGFQYAAIARNAAAGPLVASQLVAEANAAIDEFLDENDWSGNLDRELFQRSRIDGEYFLGLWHVGKGHVQARTIEPDQVTEPSNKSGLEDWLGCRRRSGLRPDRDPASGQRPDLRDETFASNWGFGVHTHEDDPQAIHGYYVQWSNRDTDWDYFPGGNEPIVPPDGAAMWMEHAKLNVVRGVKRGLSDFYPIDGNLDLARRVLRNMGEGSAVQAAIAWIQEVAPGTTQAQVHSGTLSRADGGYTSLTQQGANRTHPVQHYDPATILKVPNGQKYLPGPLGTQHAPNFITAAEALLRTVALRWNLPENLITGSAANNNFASSLVAETPFVKYAESQQQFYAQRDRKTLWRVLRFAWQAGRFGDVPWTALRQAIEITVTPPQVEVRDPEKETRVRQILHAAGVLSKKTWSAQESLDFDQEQKNLQAEAAQDAQAQPPAAGSPTSPPPNVHGEGTRHDSAPQAPHDDSAGAATTEPTTEALETWDSAKHPRGGFSQNRGWFSKAWGGASHAVSKLFAGADKPGSSGPNDADPRRIRVPGSEGFTATQDAEALAKLADSTFRNVPVERWNSEALRILTELRAKLGRPLSGDLENKFLEYVKARQAEAQRRKELEANLRKLGTLQARTAVNGSASSSPTVATFLPNDIANWMTQRAIDWLLSDPHLDPRYKQILTNLNNLVFMPGKDVLPFAKGIGYGLLVDGLWGDAASLVDVAKLGGRAALQTNPLARWLYRRQYGEEPLAPEMEAIRKAFDSLVQAWPAIEAAFEEAIKSGGDFLDALAKNDSAQLRKYGQAMQDFANAGGDVLLDVVAQATDIDPETRGRIAGFLLYQVAITFATAGLDKAAKAGKVCTAAGKLLDSGLLARYPKLKAAVEKAITVLTKLANLKVCFAAGTPVQTREGLRPIERIRPGDWVLARHDLQPDSANDYRRVQETFVTHPAELLRLEIDLAPTRETIVCTPGHPFYSPRRREFVNAGDLIPGEPIALADGGVAHIVQINRQAAMAGQTFTTYNLSVEGHRTYFVGRSGLWVHNAGGLCDELASIYQKALKAGKNGEAAAGEVVEALAKKLRQPGADVDAIRGELKKIKGFNLPDGPDADKLIAKAKERNAALKSATGGPRPSLSPVPSIRNGEFHRWFNKLTTDELKQVLSDPRLKHALEQRLRSPGGFHEWLPVSRVIKFKQWGLTAEQIHEFRTATTKIGFLPKGEHGEEFSTTAHNQLFKLIDESPDFKTYVRKLRTWANKHLVGGAAALPKGLRP